MDTASTLLGLGLFLVFIAPVGYLLYNQSFEEKKRAKRLFILAQRQGYILDESENILGLSLGLDKTKKKFLLLKSGNKADLQVIDLEDVKKIEVCRTDEDGQSTSILDEIREISLELKRASEIKKLTFYAEQEDPVTRKEERLQNAYKWHKVLSENTA